MDFLGEKISPIEVDAVLLTHPDVAQAVAFGVPDQKYGEEVCLFFSIVWKFVFFSCNVFVRTSFNILDAYK